MGPRHFFLTWLALFGLLAHSWADLDPSEVYLQGYLLMQKAGKAEKAQDNRGAFRMYREASEIFDSISQRWPTWKPSMVDYRRKLIRADVQRLASKFTDNSSPDEPALPQRSPSTGAGLRRTPTLPNGMVRPPAVPTPQERFKHLENQVIKLTSDRGKLVDQLTQKQSEQKAARQALDEAQKQVSDLKGALENSQEELQKLKGTGVEALQAQIEDLKKRLAEATDSMMKANEHTRKLLADLEAAHQTIAEMRREQEILKQDRDDMADLIKGLRGEEGAVQLATENIRLREQLNATQARLDELQAAKDQDQAELESLRQEVSGLRSQLAQVQQENEDYKVRLGELQGALLESDQTLTANPPAAGDDNAQAENAILKRIIVKQMRQQTHRQQMKELVVEELKGLEQNTDELLAKIDSLAKDSDLTSNEKEVLQGGGINLAQAPISADLPVVEEEVLRKKISRYAKAAAFDFAERRYEKAEAGYEEILQFAPQHVRTLCNLGVVKIRLNKLEDAKMLCEKALLYDQENAFTHYMLGIAQYHLEDFEGAAMSLKQSVEMDAKNADMYHFLAVVHYRRGDLPLMEEALLKAVDLRPRFSEAQFNLAVLYASRKPADLIKARHHYTLAVESGLAADERMERLFGRAMTEDMAVVPVVAVTPAPKPAEEKKPAAAKPIAEKKTPKETKPTEAKADPEENPKEEKPVQKPKRPINSRR